MKDGIWQLLGGIILVAILFVLVKPSGGKPSPAAGAIAVVSGALADMISLAINGTQRNE